MIFIKKTFLFFFSGMICVFYCNSSDVEESTLLNRVKSSREFPAKDVGKNFSSAPSVRIAYNSENENENDFFISMLPVIKDNEHEKEKGLGEDVELLIHYDNSSGNENLNHFSHGDVKPDLANDSKPPKTLHASNVISPSMTPRPLPLLTSLLRTKQDGNLDYFANANNVNTSKLYFSNSLASCNNSGYISPSYASVASPSMLAFDSIVSPTPSEKISPSSSNEAFFGRTKRNAARNQNALLAYEDSNSEPSSGKISPSSSNEAFFGRTKRNAARNQNALLAYEDSNSEPSSGKISPS
ncbi:MAG: hypothetical protein LBB12_03725, partial [Holosporaceae bacterium]|nr:hypothetical protein [Holosporaceae bacterium]